MIRLVPRIKSSFPMDLVSYVFPSHKKKVNLTIAFLPLRLFQWNAVATLIQPSPLTVSKHSSICGSGRILLGTMRHPLMIQVALNSPLQITYLLGTSMALDLARLHVWGLRFRAAELILGSLSTSSRIVCQGMRQIGEHGRMWSWVPFLVLYISPPLNSKLLCNLQTLKPRRVNLTRRSMQSLAISWSRNVYL